MWGFFMLGCVQQSCTVTSRDFVWRVPTNIALGRLGTPEEKNKNKFGI